MDVRRKNRGMLQGSMNIELEIIKQRVMNVLEVYQRREELLVDRCRYLEKELMRARCENALVRPFTEESTHKPRRKKH